MRLYGYVVLRLWLCGLGVIRLYGFEIIGNMMEAYILPFEHPFVTTCKSKGYILPCKRWPFALQNMAF